MDLRNVPAGSAQPSTVLRGGAGNRVLVPRDPLQWEDLKSEGPAGRLTLQQTHRLLGQGASSSQSPPTPQNPAAPPIGRPPPH